MAARSQHAAAAAAPPPPLTPQPEPIGALTLSNGTVLTPPARRTSPAGAMPRSGPQLSGRTRWRRNGVTSRRGGPEADGARPAAVLSGGNPAGVLGPARAASRTLLGQAVQVRLHGHLRPAEIVGYDSDNHIAVRIDHPVGNRSVRWLPFDTLLPAHQIEVGRSLNIDSSEDRAQCHSGVRPA
jgi:hypothetical protein